MLRLVFLSVQHLSRDNDNEKKENKDFITEVRFIHKKGNILFKVSIQVRVNGWLLSQETSTRLSIGTRVCLRTSSTSGSLDGGVPGGGT